MAKAKAAEIIEEPKATKEPEGFYKGYDINWLRSVKEDHPDGGLVDEYDAKKAKKEDN